MLRSEEVPGDGPLGPVLVCNRRFLVRRRDLTNSRSTMGRGVNEVRCGTQVPFPTVLVVAAQVLTWAVIHFSDQMLLNETV